MGMNRCKDTFVRLFLRLWHPLLANMCMYKASSCAQAALQSGLKHPLNKTGFLLSRQFPLANATSSKEKCFRVTYQFWQSFHGKKIMFFLDELNWLWSKNALTLQRKIVGFFLDSCGSSLATHRYVLCLARKQVITFSCKSAWQYVIDNDSFTYQRYLAVRLPWFNSSLNSWFFFSVFVFLTFLSYKNVESFGTGWRGL